MTRKIFIITLELDLQRGNISLVRHCIHDSDGAGKTAVFDTRKEAEEYLATTDEVDTTLFDCKIIEIEL